MTDWIKRKHRSLFNWITVLLPLAVLSLIGWIIVKNWSQIAAFHWRVDWKLLAVVFGLYSVALGSTFVAWQLMVARLGGFNDLRLGFRFYYISNLAKRLPTSLPYIGGRLALYQQVGVSKAAIVNCTLLETLLVGAGGVLVYVVCLPFYSIIPQKVALGVSAAGVLVIGVFLARPQLLIELTNWALRKLKRGTLTQTPGRADILLWIGIYAIPWVFAGSALYLLPRTFMDIQGPGYFDAVGIATLSTLVSLTSLVLPGGLALKELTATALLTAWMPLTAALMLSLIARLVQTINDTLWALGALLLIPAPPPVLPATPARSGQEEA